MLNKEEAKITQELLVNAKVNDEYIFRELARKMIAKMPFDELKKLIKFKKTDPTEAEMKAKINDYRTPEHERYRLMTLEYQQAILYEAEVSL